MSSSALSCEAIVAHEAPGLRCAFFSWFSSWGRWATECCN